MFRFSFAVRAILGTIASAASLSAQESPYDVFPEAKPPYYRVRYVASDQPGQLNIPGKYTVWIPNGVSKLRGIVVHQHGCGEGSCSSGLTGAYDLHWQALAKKHDCALLSPSYEQSEKAGLPDVVRPTQRLSRRVCSLARRSWQDVWASGTRLSTPSSLGAQRRWALVWRNSDDTTRAGRGRLAGAPVFPCWK